MHFSTLTLLSEGHYLTASCSCCPLLLTPRQSRLASAWPLWEGPSWTCLHMWNNPKISKIHFCFHTCCENVPFLKFFFFLSYSHMSNFLETSSAEKVKTVLSGSEWHKMTTDGQRSPFSNLSRLFVLSNLAAAGSSVHPRDRINLCDDVIPRTSCNVQDEQIKIKKKQDTRYF
jgi:hypothetical protein